MSPSLIEGVFRSRAVLQISAHFNTKAGINKLQNG